MLSKARLASAAQTRHPGTGQESGLCSSTVSVGALLSRVALQGRMPMAAEWEAGPHQIRKAKECESCLASPIYLLTLLHHLQQGPVSDQTEGEDFAVHNDMTSSTGLRSEHTHGVFAPRLMLPAVHCDQVSGLIKSGAALPSLSSYLACMQALTTRSAGWPSVAMWDKPGLGVSTIRA